MPALIVFVTAPTRKEADRLARLIVEERLAACVSIVPDITSRYWWKGKIELSQELLLILKTTTARFKALEKRIRTHHSYSVPEILAVPVSRGSRPYLQWLTRETTC